MVSDLIKKSFLTKIVFPLFLLFSFDVHAQARIIEVPAGKATLGMYAGKFDQPECGCYEDRKTKSAKCKHGQLKQNAIFGQLVSFRFGKFFKNRKNFIIKNCYQFFRDH
jgi:hypothetical protein